MIHYYLFRAPNGPLGMNRGGGVANQVGGFALIDVVAPADVFYGQELGRAGISFGINPYCGPLESI